MSAEIFSFENKKKNLKMVEGAYRKLKSHFYYNKNFILVREKIVNFENDDREMQFTFERLTELLKNPNSKESKQYIQNLANKIDFFVLPKKLDYVDNEKSDIVSNVGLQNKKIKSVNFFIDAPIEIYLLDVLFAFFLAKAAAEKDFISSNVYGNCVYDEVLTTPNFESRRFFKNYFPQYCNWRNNAFKQLDFNYKHNKHSLLISLDLQGYFYSVKFNFATLRKIRKDSSCSRVLLTLQKIMQPVYESYKKRIEGYRKDLCDHDSQENPLPIGLFSSMVLGNIYLSEFDKKISNNDLFSYYGRYVDDCLFVVDTEIDACKTKSSIIEQVFKGILAPVDETFAIVGCENLKIQQSKINVIHIDPKEPRAILDIYNKEIRILPSQTNPLPISNLKLELFDENIYNVDNFLSDGKVRNIGKISANALAVGNFFQSLLTKFSHVDPNSSNRSNNAIGENKEQNVLQIKKFFKNSNIIEYSTHWMSFFYFLVTIKNYKEFNQFYREIDRYINQIDDTGLDFNLVRRPAKSKTLIKAIKRDLKKQLDIAAYSAQALDFTSIQKRKSRKKYFEVRKYVKANMFNHSLVALPLANYIEYDG
ncbi:MAG: hypothetical protein HUK21_09475, partial [Fibrobacteraceae bacterium]|nr:hypothetical protein [Fibrobacteraceae bacterium]